MGGETTIYLTELFKIALSLLPVTLVLFAMIFLRRRERTPQTLWLQSLAGLWLIFAGIGRILIGSAVGFSLFRQSMAAEPAEASQQIDLYFKLGSLIHYGEMAAFTLFAVGLVIYFHERLPKKVPSLVTEPDSNEASSLPSAENHV